MLVKTTMIALMLGLLHFHLTITLLCFHFVSLTEWLWFLYNKVQQVLDLEHLIQMFHCGHYALLHRGRSPNSFSSASRACET